MMLNEGKAFNFNLMEINMYVDIEDEIRSEIKEYMEDNLKYNSLDYRKVIREAKDFEQLKHILSTMVDDLITGG